MEEILDDNKMHEVWRRTRFNKRRSRDSVEFELFYERNLLKLKESINDRTYDAKEGNYTFVVHSPKPREIFATKTANRIVHHFLDMELRPIYEKVLSPNSFNNRVGKGIHNAINTFVKYLKEVSENFTKPAYVYHLDIKGFFPNANVGIILKQQIALIRKYYEGTYKNTLEFLMRKVFTCDPARNCTKIVPDSSWDCIEPSKSLFNKPIGTGLQIGFLCCQNAMGIYPNNVTKFIERLYKVVVFVDDIFVIDSDKTFLRIIPLVRNKFLKLKIELNEKKFYCQHYSKGILCLGRFIKGSKIFICKSTVIRSILFVKGKLESVNSYIGLYRDTDSIRDFARFVSNVCSRFSFSFIERKLCFC